MTALDTESGAGRTEGLSSTATGQPVPTAFERARSRLTGSDPRVGWAAALGVALLAFALRVHRLGSPNVVAFDETYYAKDAWSLLHFGYVKEYLKDADGNTKTDINADMLTLGLIPDELVLTRDQVTLLESDNVVSAAAAAEGRDFAGLGIAPTSVEAIVSSYLWRFRKTGQFDTARAN